MIPLLNISSGLGLAGAAGLNAYIPMLLVAIMANRGMIHLNGSYAMLGDWWCVSILSVLLVIEMVVDKVPGLDHVNDVIHTVIRPVAGAIMFGSQAGAIGPVPPAMWSALGLLAAGSVHGVKSVSRPVVNLTTLGVGAPVVSLAEDVASATLSVLALVAPLVCLVALGFVVWGMWMIYRRVRGRGGVGVVATNRFTEVSGAGRG